MVNDTYVILRKGPGGQYSSISASMDRKKADACLALLKVNKPGKYLLLNLRTNLIERVKRKNAGRTQTAGAYNDEPRGSILW